MAHRIVDAHVAALPILVMNEPSAVLHQVAVTTEGLDVHRLPVLIGEVEVSLHLAEMDASLLLFHTAKITTNRLQ